MAVGTNFPGTTWLKVIERILGSNNGLSAEIETQDEEPRQTYAPSLAFIIPAPTAAIGPSPPPVTTGVPTNNPVCALASLVISPRIEVEGRISGNSAASMRAAARIRVDQTPFTWSKALVLDASDGSVASRPVNLKFT